MLVYETEPLDQDVITAGPIKVSSNVSTTGTDSDFVVKGIDVYPADYPTPTPKLPKGQRPPSNAVRMGAYQQLVRGEPFRGKYRNIFEKPEPFTPGKAAVIAFELPDVSHAFRRGHRIMVQVQSSWFPLVDRNPQTFMEIPQATATDYRKAINRVYRARDLDSNVTLYIQGAVPTVIRERRRSDCRQRWDKRLAFSGTGAPPSTTTSPTKTIVSPVMSRIAVHGDLAGCHLRARRCGRTEDEEYRNDESPRGFRV